MKTGLSLMELAQKIEDQRRAKVDMVAPTSHIALSLEQVIAATKEQEAVMAPKAIVSGYREKGQRAERRMGITDIAHRQLASKTGIPKPYYDLMLRKAPDLLVNNANYWLGKDDEPRLVRVMHGNMRALLSDRYQRVDNDEVANVVLPVLGDVPGIEVVSCEITERRMYIKAVTAKIQGDVKKGDVVRAGVMISNSEVGLGAVTVAPLLYRLACLNGMIQEDSRYRGYHVGARNNVGDETYAILSNEALAADDRAVLLKTRDVVKAALSQAMFDKFLGRAQEAASPGTKITGDPAKVLEILTKELDITDQESGGVLRHLIEGGDLTKWGVGNAVTRFAQDV